MGQHSGGADVGGDAHQENGHESNKENEDYNNKEWHDYHHHRFHHVKFKLHGKNAYYHYRKFYAEQKFLWNPCLNMK